MAEHSRRELLQIATATLASVPARAQEHRFFTPDEFRMVDELAEIIIPADEHSPGARAAKVAEYIDFRLGETLDEESRRDWREGLQTVNALSQQMNGAPFLQATPQQRVAVVTRMARNEKHPRKPEEEFFAELKQRTANAYYTSDIGIHQEINYEGNVMLKEFVGIDAGTVAIPEELADHPE